MIAAHVAEWTRCLREQRRLYGVLKQIADPLPFREVGSSGMIIDTPRGNLSFRGSNPRCPRGHLAPDFRIAR
jgi:hypothetical protein